jgi:ApaG protein
MYTATTRSIRVSVESSFVEEQSSPDEGRWVFAYRVTIENQGPEPVQLISRHWKITDAHGRTVEVRGPGVIGKQPRLAPGERFQYMSGAPLGTPSGLMVGTYQMIDARGRPFDVEIPAFSLDAPEAPRAVH